MSDRKPTEGDDIAAALERAAEADDLAKSLADEIAAAEPELSLASPAASPAEKSALPRAEKSALTPAEKSALTPAEKSALNPAEKSALTPAEKSALTPAEKSALTPAEKSALTPAEKSALTPAEKSALTPAEKSALTPAEKPPLTLAEKPALSHAEKSALSPAEKSALTPAEKSTLTLAEKPALSPAERPALTLAEKPALSPAEESTLTLAERPALSPAERPALTLAEKPAPTPLTPALSPRSQGEGVWRAGVVLATAAVVALVFDTEGLLTWARRLEAGRTQDAVVATLTPVHDSLSRLKLDAPRHWLAAHAPGQGDAVLARGWVDPTVRHVVAMPVMQLSVDAPQPETAPAPTPVAVAPEPAPGRTGGILLVGDSMMAGSLGATLERTLARASDDVPVTRAAQLGTGLARPDLYDWMNVIPALLEREQPRFVVVSLGANDGTTLRDGERTIEFGDPRWKEVYASRVDTVMRTLAGEDTQVLWLLLPPMRDPRLNARGAILNGIFTQRSKRAPRVEVLELDVLLSNDDRQYATFVQTDDGKLVRYRLDDGVHLAPAGSRAVARWVVDWVRERQRTRPPRPRSR